MASIQETLLTALAGDAELAALTGPRIFPGEVPDDQNQSPFLLYQVPESVPFDSLDESNGIDVRSELVFHALADRYSQAKLITERVRAVLKALVLGAVFKLVMWTGTSEEETEDGFHHASRFTVFWFEAAE